MISSGRNCLQSSLISSVIFPLKKSEQPKYPSLLLPSINVYAVLSLPLLITKTFIFLFLRNSGWPHSDGFRATCLYNFPFTGLCPALGWADEQIEPQMQLDLLFASYSSKISSMKDSVVTARHGWSSGKKESKDDKEYLVVKMPLCQFCAPDCTQFLWFRPEHRLRNFLPL